MNFNDIKVILREGGNYMTPLCIIKGSKIKEFNNISFKHLAVRGVCKTAGFSLFFDPRVLIFVIFEVIFTKLSQFRTDPRKSQSPFGVSLLYHTFPHL